MNIGEAARQSGVNAKAIRYYESIGLLPAADRTQSGYRQYSAQDVERLALIGRARRLGFAIEDVRRLVKIYGEQPTDRSDIRGLVLQHVAEIDQKLAELNAIRATLVELAAKVETEDLAGAELLDRLSASSTVLAGSLSGGQPDGADAESLARRRA